MMTGDTNGKSRIGRRTSLNLARMAIPDTRLATNMIDKFINKVLYDKKKGYYMNNNPIGHKGDFITSPNISIMFSEMIAIWLISFWEKIGSPKNINIIELGAGNGEMMLQILKTVEKFNKFKSSSNFIIYEKSPYLKKLQKNKIKFENIKWISNLKKISNFGIYWC